MSKKNQNKSENFLKNEFTITISPLAILAIIMSIVIYKYSDLDNNREEICDIAAVNQDGGRGGKYQWFSFPEYDKNKNYIHLDNGAFVYRHIYMDEFEQEFNVQPLYYTVLDPEVKEILDKHNLTARLNNVTDIDRNFINDRFKKSEQLAPYIKEVKERVERGDSDLDDGRIYIRWVNDHVKYGMFAGKDFEKHEVLGLYTGYITKGLSDFEYAWEYNYLVTVQDENGARIGICIDGKHRGNYMRFANHRDKNQNGDQFYVIYDNIWHVLYIAQSSIKAHEQILVNYGEAYWKTKNKYDL